MARDGEHRFPGFGRSARSSLLHWLSKGDNVKAFLNAIAARHEGKLGAGDHPKSISVLTASQYLETCCEKVVDAYTVEDAIYWHSEIITELACEIHAVHATDWPSTVKATMTAALEDRLNQHGEAVNRLTGVLQRNEQLIWQP